MVLRAHLWSHLWGHLWGHLLTHLMAKRSADLQARRCVDSRLIGTGAKKTASQRPSGAPALRPPSHVVGRGHGLALVWCARQTQTAGLLGVFRMFRAVALSAGLQGIPNMADVMDLTKWTGPAF